MNASEAVAKVSGPPQTMEIKLGNLTLTGVLWLCSDHTGVISFDWPVVVVTSLLVLSCVEINLLLCSQTKRIPHTLSTEVLSQSVFGPSCLVMVFYYFLWLLKIHLSFSTFLQWFAKSSPKGLCRYLYIWFTQRSNLGANNAATQMKKELSEGSTAQHRSMNTF